MGELQHKKYGEERFYDTGVEDPLPTITSEHAMGHAGLLWTTSTEVSVVAGQKTYILMKTGGQRIVHLRKFKFDMDGGPCKVRLYEASTVLSANFGTPLVPSCTNRIIKNDPHTIVTQGPTPGALGNEIDFDYLPAAANKVSASMGDTLVEEFVLALNTIYLIELENVDAQDHVGGFKLYFYEKARRNE